ncbi:MFS transporter [Litchfieldella rifensis]|uniref:MFS transporter n=1 Tax=Litchfieldella rifensis TaxID=762643 RepID=A0ABV7LTY2_9GAMM
MLRFPSRHHRQVTLTYFGMFVGAGMTAGLLGPALPHLAAMTGSSMSQIAILFTARALGTMIGAVSAGLLLDRLPGHRLLTGMVLLAVLGLVLAPLSVALAVLTAVVFLLGLSEVSLNTGGNTLLLWTHREMAGPHISALHFCFGLGNMLVPLVMITAIALTGQFHWAFWLVGLYLLALIWPLSRLASPLRQRSREGAPEESPAKPRDAWLLAGFMLMFGLYVGTEITFAGWITTYGTLNGLSADDAAFLVSLFWLALSLGRLLAIPLLGWGSPWTMLYGCLGLGLLTALALHALWLPLSLAVLLFGLSASALFPTLLSLGNQVMEMTGRNTGLIFLACGLGAMIAPSLTGPLLDLVGAQAFPLLLAGLVILLMAALLMLRARLTNTGVLGTTTTA